jgi:methylenetetrahydrofolate reductase (NADPH)
MNPRPPTNFILRGKPQSFGALEADMKIIDKIRQNASDDPFFSFEFFPPKTEAGVENLYLRMDRMTSVQPLFIDITWGAGGCTKDLTMAICEYAQTYFGVETLMHLTCTGLTVEEIKKILKSAKEMGIQNILALRGDPPKGAISWEPAAGGCNNAIDLVKLIRSEHGNHFCIAVAGFPEGHPYTKERKDQDLIFLKEKIDAGADFILTQFFYDPEVFVDFHQRCNAIGITCPILPGMMPIQSYTSFKKMTTFCRTKVPEHIWQSLQPMKDNDEEVKEFGVQLCKDMCETLRERCNVQGYHFYTLNLEKSVMNVLTLLGVKESAASRR